MILSRVLFLCPHCGFQDHAKFHEPADGGGDRSMTLKGECWSCRKLWKVEVKVVVEREEVGRASA